MLPLDRIEILAWMMTVLGLVGTYLNAKKEVCGFYFWIVSNTTFCWICFEKECYPQSFLFGVYTFLAFKGIYEWTKNDKPECQCIST